MNESNKNNRSYIMSRVPRKNSEQELIVRRFLYKNNIRYRIHFKINTCTPDIVITKIKTVIFIHGCFWPGHENCHYSRRPNVNMDYWFKKMEENTKRDKLQVEMLENSGWNVLTIWQCELKNKSSRESTLNNVLIQLKNNRK